MVEDLAGVGMVDTVIDVVTGFTIPERFPDDFCNKRAGVCDQEPAGSARISISGGKRRVISALSFTASSSMDLTSGLYFTGTRHRYRGYGSSYKACSPLQR